MMGQRSGNQEQVFYAFNLDDHVTKGHLLRGITSSIAVCVIYISNSLILLKKHVMRDSQR